MMAVHVWTKPILDVASAFYIASRNAASYRNFLLLNNFQATGKDSDYSNNKKYVSVICSSTTPEQSCITINRKWKSVHPKRDAGKENEKN